MGQEHSLLSLAGFASPDPSSSVRALFHRYFRIKFIIGDDTFKFERTSQNSEAWVILSEKTRTGSEQPAWVADVPADSRGLEWRSSEGPLSPAQSSL